MQDHHRIAGALGAVLALGVAAFCPAATNRVTDGLAALYSFEDGAGAAVADGSGVAYPLHLAIANTNLARWLPGGGLAVRPGALAASPGAASNVVAVCRSNDAFSVELWLEPNDLLQGGPGSGVRAPIVALAASVTNRNFVVEQEGNGYVVRVRTSASGSAGAVTLYGPATLALTHLVATHDSAGRATLYVNGAQVYANVFDGDLSAWNGAQRLALANDLDGSAAWAGKLHGVAIYARALSADEAALNFSAGPHGTNEVPPAIVVQPAGVSVEEPAPVSFSVVAGGSVPLAYQWRRDGSNIADAVFAAYDLTATSASNDNGAAFDVVVSNAFGAVTSQVATLTVTPHIPVPPSIPGEPLDVAVTEPAAAVFSVSAAGDPPLAYQWRRGDADIPGAQSFAYTLTPTSTNDSGAGFAVVVSNVYGAVTSRVATLTVSARVRPPQIVAEPLDAAVLAPAAATFGVTASGDEPLYYQWRRNGTNILLAMGVTYTVNATSTNDNGARFDVVVQNAYGAVTSRLATLTVTMPPPAPPAIVRDPADATVTAPSGVGFTVSGEGDPPLAYQWRRDGTNIAGATGASYALAATATNDNGAAFRVVVSNPYGAVTSAVAVLTVLAPPTHPPLITVQPADTAVTAPAGAGFTVTANGDAPLAYQWRRDGTHIAGATAAAYVLAVTATNDNDAGFSVVVSNPYGVATSRTARLTVNPVPTYPPLIDVPPAGRTVTAPRGAIFAVLASGGTPLYYQWRRDGTNLPGARAAFYELAATTLADSGAAFDAIVSNSYGIVTSAVAVLTVIPDPNALATIEGIVSYGGAATGSIVVAAYTNAALGPAPAAAVTLSHPGAYALGNLYSGTYYVAATMLLPPRPDADHIRPANPWVVLGTLATPTPVPVPKSATVSGIDLALADGATNRPNPFAAAGTPFDFDGDWRADIAIAVDATGKIRMRPSGGGTDTITTLGRPAWVPAVADFDGDGRADYAWFVPGSGVWRILESSTGYAERKPRPVLGIGTDIPVPADYDGDGRADVAVFLSASGKIRALPSGGGPMLTSSIGKAAWKPAVADYDGDGKADFAWFVPGAGNWRILESSRAYAERLPRPLLGTAGDTPVPADFDGDGRADPAVFEGATGRFSVRPSSTGWLQTSAIGKPAWVPAVADYDGDGKADYAWFLPGSGKWRILESSRAYAERLPRPLLGVSADWPVAAPLAP